MPYTNKSIAFVWLMTFGLFALSGSGVIPGRWLLPFLLVALAAPALILRGQRRVALTATSSERARVISHEHDRSPFDLGGIDVYRWENEGGAPPMYVIGVIGEPVQAAP